MKTKTTVESKPSNWALWHEPRTKATLVSSFIILFLAVFVAAALAFYAAEADRWVLHTVEVRRVNLRLLNTVQTAESAERGFLITGDARYMTRFEGARDEIARLMSELLNNTDDNTEQQQRVIQLRGVVETKVKELEDTLALLQQGNRDAAVAAVREHLVHNVMDEVRDISGSIDQTETRLLIERTDKAQRGRWSLVAVVVALLFISGALALSVFRALQNLLRVARDNAARLAKEIEEREATENQLRQAQKMEALGQLTGGVAHDFNNMLAVIVGNLDILLRHVSDHDGRTRRLVGNALEGATRASSLTHQLLAFSRLQPLSPKPLEINKCINEVSSMLRRTLGENIAIESVLGGGVWHAYVDRPQLESAILNLAINARDAMPASGGKLTIETANTYLDQAYIEAHSEVKEGQYVLIAVTDTGRGMPPGVIQRVFEPFFTTKPPGTGTGLGLSQVHGFIKQSGGHVTVYSEEGTGTTVKLYLPRYAGPIEDPTTWHGEQTLRANHDAAVLVVEDEQGVREFVVNALQELGYRVYEADSAAAAIKLLEMYGDIKLLLTDVIMPVKNGRELADEVTGRWPHLKILYMTGYTRNAIVHNGVLDAGTRLLTKPFTLKQLEVELRNLLG